MSYLGKDFASLSEVEGKQCWNRVRFKMTFSILSLIWYLLRITNIFSFSVCLQVFVSTLKIKN